MRPSARRGRGSSLPSEAAVAEPERPCARGGCRARVAHVAQAGRAARAASDAAGTASRRLVTARACGGLAACSGSRQQVQGRCRRGPVAADAGRGCRRRGSSAPGATFVEPTAARKGREPLQIGDQERAAPRARLGSGARKIADGWIRRHDRRTAPAARNISPCCLRHAEALPEQRLRRRRAEHDDERRLHRRDLRLEPRRGRPRPRRRAASRGAAACRAARVPLEMLDGVA